MENNDIIDFNSKRQLQLAIEEIALLRASLRNEVTKVQFLKSVLSLLKLPEGSIESRHHNNIIENAFSSIEDRLA